jgi:uncharacterized cupredoxin-like copper-binding protein
MIKYCLIIIACFSLVANAQVVGPKASSQQMEFDFGTVEQGQITTHNYTLVNNGDDILKITDVHASCGCTAAKPDKNELAPGESINIKVEFNSTGKMGKQEKWIYVKTNDPNNKELKFKLTGNVLEVSEVKDSSTATSQLYFFETEHDFGTVKEGQVVDYTFKFKNTGKGVLVVKNVSTSCGCTVALISSKKIEPGKEGTIRVELDTKEREGKLNRNITIQSNDPKEPNKALLIFADIIREKK